MSEAVELPAKLDPKNYMDARVAAITYGRGSSIHRMSDRTHSMLGTGYNGAFLVVAPQKDYRAQDDVMFRNASGGTTVHRVIAVRPGFIFTKGINNKRGDGWVPIESVVGRVVWPKPRM